MKKYLTILIPTILLSCNVLEVDQLNSTDGGATVTDNDLRGPNTVPTSSTEILTLLHENGEKRWDAEGFTLFGMNGFLPCRLDDQITLSVDGSYTYDGGNSLCGAEDNVRIKQGTWELSDDLESLVFTEGENTFVAALLGITSDQISLRSNYQGLEVNAVYTSN